MMKILYMFDGTIGVGKQLYANNLNGIYRIAYFLMEIGVRTQVPFK